MDAATICGITASHVSMLTCPNPSTRLLPPGAAPWLNHSVNNRRMSCNEPAWPLFLRSAPPSATERKKPEMAGATWRRAAAAVFGSRAYCSMAAALNRAQ